MCLRRLSGPLGEKLITMERLADWGFAAPGSEAERRAQQRAEQREALKKAEQEYIRQKESAAAALNNQQSKPVEAVPSDIRRYLTEQLNLVRLLPQLTCKAWCRQNLEMDHPVLISYEDRRTLIRRQQIHGEDAKIYSAVMCSVGETDYFVRRMTVDEFERLKTVMRGWTEK